MNTLHEAAKAMVRSSNKGDEVNKYSKCLIPNDFSRIIFKKSLTFLSFLAAWWAEISANSGLDTNFTSCADLEKSLSETHCKEKV